MVGSNPNLVESFYNFFFCFAIRVTYAMLKGGKKIDVTCNLKLSFFLFFAPYRIF